MILIIIGWPQSEKGLKLYWEDQKADRMGRTSIE